eukprot:Gregarina_sp_Poly_1__10817@NODE_834_length_6076_cov_122_476286_g602_i0_p3_GENE_NODE_834_length_6076_cov_122_476286_g602_i0NODE_834_length_6076_cov_122_476286_g602_i0_p3_ORF_typecomplete_len298_score42_73Hydrolase_3/PF08282_12/7_6e38S6PP/PF05116_13/3_6S6PP/PF05116_13/0_05HAD/PF12710_7/7_9e02HAD/PF12710_7/0_12_NODE_834_length_6076_cov_122_476286_g602_i051025995
MMKSISWICTDVDGTFLDSHHQISPLTEQSYIELQRRGIDVIFATGRTPRATMDVMERSPEFKNKYVKFCPGIYCNGALVLGEDFEDLISVSPPPLKALRAFADFAYQFMKDHSLERKIILLVHHTKGSYIDYDGEIWRSFQSRWEEERAVPLNDSITSVLKESDDVILQLHAVGAGEHVQAMVAACESDPVMMNCLNELGVYLVSGIPECATVVRKDVNKAEGIAKLINRYSHKYRIEELMVLGDGDNDREMLQLKGALSAAMGQSSKSLHAIATVVAPSNSEEGWSTIVSEKVLS